METVYFFETLVYTSGSQTGYRGTQGCRKFLLIGLLLTNESQITLMVSDFLCILLQTKFTILKIANLTTVVYTL